MLLILIFIYFFQIARTKRTAYVLDVEEQMQHVTTSACHDAVLARRQQQQEELQAEARLKPKLETHAQPEAEAHIPPVDHIIRPLSEGDPMDLTLLWSYKDHVVRHVWIGKPRGELKLVSHGGNVISYPPR